MSKSIRIEPSPRTVKAVAATAKALRFRPEDIYILAAGQLSRYVEKHRRCIAPLLILSPDTHEALGGAIRATGFTGEAADLAEHLLADAVKQFKAGDYSLITKRSRKAIQAKRRAKA